MAAPAGNKFWQNRSRHGVEKLFASADLLWAAAEEYFEWCDLNPWMKAEAIKSGDLAGKIMEIPSKRPYTMSGFCVYLGVNSVYFNQFKLRLKPEEKDGDKDFAKIIGQIEEVMYTQKFEGAAVGAFNANIIARDLGLKDRTEIDHTSKGESIQFYIPDNGRNKDNSTAEGVSGEDAQQSS